MARDPLIARHAGEFAATLAGRLQALVVDLRQIVSALRENGTASAQDVHAWRESANTGTGRATTARGPVFHQVTLDPRDKVLQWRAVAPTDWHFAPRGPVARALGPGVVNTAARLAIAGFDPCAPWTLERVGAH
jgi:Ni,Fe-hydrogenase I large subunit